MRNMERHKQIKLAVKRGIDMLKTWVSNRNELVRFYAAKGLWESDKNLASQTLRELHRRGSRTTVKLVKDLMEEWGIS